MNTPTAIQVAQPAQPRSLVAKFAGRYGVEPAKLMETLKATAFKQPKDGAVISNEQMMALLIVADQYNLNPFTKEVYAFPAKGGGIVPVVSVDGWARIINEHPQFDGLTFAWPNDDGTCCVCTIYRKDRAHPIAVPEYLAECKRSTEPWGSHPRRMLRHKALIQCARVAFGFAGIYDPDEAKRIEQGGWIDNETGEIVEGRQQQSKLDAVRSEASKRKPRQAAEPEPVAAEVPAEPTYIHKGDGTFEPAEASPEPAKAVKAKPAAATPAKQEKHPDDPSAGAAPGVPRADLIRRIALLERTREKEDALVIIDEVRDEATEGQIADLMAVVTRRWPE